MINKNNNCLITEISEEDFRKLHLKGRSRTSSVAFNGALTWKEVDLNQELDENIEYWIDSGYESDLADLKCPVTVALHVCNDEEEPTDFYYDKFMNRFTGATTYQLGMGIPHLYSTRDYYEMHGDYWKVKKNETKVIYRIHLDEKWLKKFVLKHKTTEETWPYIDFPDEDYPVTEDAEEVLLCICYDLVDGQWKENGRYCKIKYKYSSACIPVDKDGNKIKR